MALQVWLPLNGDLTQQGLSNTIASINGTATVDNAGKIGKCYSFSGGSNCLKVNYGNNIPANNLSISCWAYIVANSHNKIIFGVTNGSNQRLYVGIQSDYYQLAYGAQSWGNTPQTAKATIGEWHHIAVSIDNNVCSMYYDGKFIHSISQTAFNLASDIMIGGRADGYTGSVKINDFRIYDHALSAKEVKELAKGLVLHYRLAGPGQENLFVNTHFDSQYSYSGWNTTKNGTQCANSWGGNNMGVGNPTTVYHAHLVEKDGEWVYNYHKTNDENWLGISQSGLQNKVIAGETYIFSCDLYRISGTNGPHGGFYTKTSSSASNSFVSSFNFISDFSLAPVGKWIHYSQSLILPTSLYLNDGCAFYIYGMSGGNGEFLMRRPKLEKGSVATPWCPNSADPLYHTLGYDNNIEYDCSGYRRNGTKSGTITWDIDSPRYTTSYKWPAATSAANRIISPNCRFDGKGITMAVWVKFTGTTAGGGAYHMPLESSSPGYYEMSVASNGILRAGIYVNGTRYVENCSNPSMYDGKWHHIAMTYDGTKICRYVDAKAYVQTNITGTANGLEQAFYLGSYGTNTSYYNNNIWESDARVYTTALSAEDIAELYHSAVIVDNTGKNYAYEYFEA